MTALDSVNGAVCDAQYQQSNPSSSCLTRGDSIGLVVTAEASTLSFIFVTVIFIWIGRNVHWYMKNFPNNSNWTLFQKPSDIFMTSLFMFDLVQAIGGILNVRWAHNGVVTTGPYCTAQGLIEQIGDLGVALMTLFLAVHTFAGAVWKVGLKERGFALGLVCLACLFITLWASIGPIANKHYETPTPYWCWISTHYSKDRLGGEYIWMWIALFVSVMLYIPLYFWAEGFWSVDEEYRFHWLKDRRVEYAQRRAALGMLLYPLAYSIIVLPLSIARWLQFGNHHVPPAATFFANSIFYLSGTINVILFLILKPELLLFSRPEELGGEEVELAQGPGPAMIPEVLEIQRSPELAPGALEGEGPRDGARPYRVNSRPTSDVSI